MPAESVGEGEVQLKCARCGETFSYEPRAEEEVGAGDSGTTESVAVAEAVGSSDEPGDATEATGDGGAAEPGTDEAADPSSLVEKAMAAAREAAEAAAAAQQALSFEEAARLAEESARAARRAQEAAAAAQRAAVDAGSSVEQAPAASETTEPESGAEGDSPPAEEAPSTGPAEAEAPAPEAEAEAPPEAAPAPVAPAKPPASPRASGKKKKKKKRKGISPPSPYEISGGKDSATVSGRTYRRPSSAPPPPAEVPDSTLELDEEELEEVLSDAPEPPVTSQTPTEPPPPSPARPAPVREEPPRDEPAPSARRPSPKPAAPKPPVEEPLWSGASPDSPEEYEPDEWDDVDVSVASQPPARAAGIAVLVGLGAVALFALFVSFRNGFVFADPGTMMARAFSSEPLHEGPEGLDTSAVNGIVVEREGGGSILMVVGQVFNSSMGTKGAVHVEARVRERGEVVLRAEAPCGHIFSPEELASMSTSQIEERYRAVASEDRPLRPGNTHECAVVFEQVPSGYSEVTHQLEMVVTRAEAVAEGSP